MGRRVDEAEWLERRNWVEGQAASGLSAARYCPEHGLNPTNFQASKPQRTWKPRANSPGSHRGLREHRPVNRG